MEKQKITKTQEQRLSDQMDDLAQKKADQLANGKPTVVANRDSSYQIPEDEQDDYVHVWTRIRNMNPDQKSFTDEDRIIPVHANLFDAKVSQGAFSLYDEVKVVHDPRKEAPPKNGKYALKVDVIKQSPQTAAPGKDLKEKENKLRVIQEEQEKKSEELEDKETELEDKETELKKTAEQITKDKEDLQKKADEIAAQREQFEADKRQFEADRKDTEANQKKADEIAAAKRKGNAESPGTEVK